MLDVAVLVERVEGARLSEKASENAQSSYNLNVSLSERDRGSGELVLSFMLELTSQPPVARIAITGIATIKGNKDEVANEITAPDDTNPPKILVTVYERVYGLLYLVAGSLKVPHPMPNLIKKGS
ncbi:MAG: hypothetical protein OK404_03055 [Thaumarchaeota archaeon]|nr:hypothetical protein [Nitrososphaerota archaeon]